MISIFYPLFGRVFRGFFPEWTRLTFRSRRPPSLPRDYQRLGFPLKEEARYLHMTFRTTKLLSPSPSTFEAMHEYDPACFLFTFCRAKALLLRIIPLLRLCWRGRPWNKQFKRLSDFSYAPGKRRQIERGRIEVITIREEHRGVPHVCTLIRIRRQNILNCLSTFSENIFARCRKSVGHKLFFFHGKNSVNF